MEPQSVPLVQSVLGTAASTFNNSALASPWFLQSAALAIPVFIAVWLASDAIIGRIMPDAKKRPLSSKVWIFISFVLWAAFGVGNFAALREPASMVEVLVPAVLFLSAWGAAHSAVQLGSVPATRLGRAQRVALIAGILLLVGFAGARNLSGMFLPIAGIAGGFIGGFYSARYSGALKSFTQGYPIISSGVVMLLSASCILMQPELFRFGQLGNLDASQLMGLGFVAVSAPMAAVLTMMARVKRARGFLGEVAHGRVMWLMRLIVLLCAILFFITESIVTFLILAASAIPYAMVSGGHQPYAEARAVNTFAFDVWCITLFVFGLVAGSFASAFLGVILWRSIPHKGHMEFADKLL
ncbi:MAG: hypothetical protein LBB23_04695 [Rickettsiales bacterium]|jgi:hypothetical protein|nr:hypothetical protein [Rickettsiales bacterium]